MILHIPPSTPMLAYTLSGLAIGIFGTLLFGMMIRNNRIFDLENNLKESRNKAQTFAAKLNGKICGSCAGSLDDDLHFLPVRGSGYEKMKGIRITENEMSSQLINEVSEPIDLSTKVSKPKTYEALKPNKFRQWQEKQGELNDN